MSLFVNQDFEGTGTPSGWFRGGSANFDYSAVPLSGSQSLRCDIATGDVAELQSGGVLNHSEVWVKFLVKFESLSTGKFFSFDDGSFNFNYATLYVVAGKLTIGDSSPVFQSTVDAMSAGTVYNIWMHWKKGTGSNGILEASFDVAGSPRPNSGNKFTGATNSNGTGNVTILRCMPQNTTIAVFDDLQVADTDMFAGAVDVTVNLTGVGATPAVGVLGFNGSLPLVGVAASPALGTGTISGNAIINLTGVAASPAVGIGHVAIQGEVIVPPDQGLVTGGPPHWYGILKDEKVYLTGVSANPQVGTITPMARGTLEELEKMYPFPKPARRLVPRRKPKPTAFVYMLGVHPVPKIGSVTTKAFYEDDDEELSSILRMMDVDEEVISALKLAK